MHCKWSEAIAIFETFAERRHLVLIEEKEDSSFGDRLATYGNGAMSVRLASDRGSCHVQVAEVITRPAVWYDMEILRDHLSGRSDGELSLQAQFDLLESNWGALTDAFGAGNREATHEQLSILRKERAKRLFPDFYRNT